MSLDALLFAVFTVESAVPGIPVAIAGAELASIGLVLLASFRRRRFDPGISMRFVLSWGVLVAFAVLSSFVNDADPTRRAVRLALMVILAASIASGRIDLRAGLKGLGAALALNVLLHYGGITPRPYGDVLTGLIPDKNVAGLYYVVFPLLLIVFVSRHRTRLLLLAGAFLAIFATGSRTSMAAMASALVWIGLGRRIPPLLRPVVLVAIWFAIGYAEDNLARIGIFSDREGTDELRERINEASQEKALTVPWYGLGLGAAKVYLQGQWWFFHDSSLAAYVEGGWILLVGIVAIYVLFGLPRALEGEHNHASNGIEATVLAMAVCAGKLGEVWLSLPGFVALGAAMLVLNERRSVGVGMKGGRE